MALSLNEEQQAPAYSPPDGIVLIKALAGSGKTRSLRERVRFIRASDDDAGLVGTKILFMAFNKSVKKELEERLKDDLPEKDFKLVDVQTFHGQALSMVKRFRDLTPVKREIELMTKSWELDMYAKEWLERYPEYAGKLRDNQLKILFGLEARRIRMGWSMNEVIEKSHGVGKALKMNANTIIFWTNVLRTFRYETGRITFDDLLELAANLPPEAYRATGYTHVVADELQDLNIRQRQIVRNFMQVCQSFTGVGDAFQSIYGFVGADSSIFDKMLVDFPDARVYELQTNYRSTPQILHLANELLGNELGTNMRLKARADAPHGPAPIIYSGVDGMKSWIETMRLSGYDWQDMLILYRARKHTPDLELALSEAGIPYKLDDGSYFEQAVIQDILCYFSLLYKAKIPKSQWVRSFTHIKYLGTKSAMEIFEKTDGDPLSWPRDMYPKAMMKAYQREKLDAFWNFYDDLAKLATTPVEAARKIVEGLQGYWLERFSDDPEKLGERLDTAASFVDWVADFGASGDEIMRSIEARERGEGQADADPNRVEIMTVHKSKGLERKAVALWMVGDGSFPLENGDPDEERRLLYVAVTRAQQDLGIVLADESQRHSTLTRLIPDARNIVKAIFEDPLNNDLADLFDLG